MKEVCVCGYDTGCQGKKRDKRYWGEERTRKSKGEEKKREEESEDRGAPTEPTYLERVRPIRERGVLHCVATQNPTAADTTHKKHP